MTIATFAQAIGGITIGFVRRFAMKAGRDAAAVQAGGKNGSI
jgi:hypothetical protein